MARLHRVQRSRYGVRALPRAVEAGLRNGGHFGIEWADLFTEDAEYIEHLYGTFRGRESIRTWITTTMAEPLNNEMTAFPAEWWVIDEARGWVVPRCGTGCRISATVGSTRPSTGRC